MAVSNKIIINNEAGKLMHSFSFNDSLSYQQLNEDLFRYKLRAYPPALFDTSVLPRLSNKASHAKAIWSLLRETQVTVVTDAQFVLDDGALLRLVPLFLGKQWLTFVIVM